MDFFPCTIDTENMFKPKIHHGNNNVLNVYLEYTGRLSQTMMRLDEIPVINKSSKEMPV